LSIDLLHSGPSAATTIATATYSMPLGARGYGTVSAVTGEGESGQTVSYSQSPPSSPTGFAYQLDAQTSPVAGASYAASATDQLQNATVSQQFFHGPNSTQVSTDVQLGARGYRTVTRREAMESPGKPSRTTNRCPTARPVFTSQMQAQTSAVSDATYDVSATEQLEKATVSQLFFHGQDTTLVSTDVAGGIDFVDRTVSTAGTVGQSFGAVELPGVSRRGSLRQRAGRRSHRRARPSHSAPASTPPGKRNYARRGGSADRR
jgi:hypothetical protein